MADTPEAPDPFGGEPPRWYKSRSSGAPKELAFLTGIVGAVCGWFAASMLGTHGMLAGGIVAVVAIGPSWLLETVWRRRKRREAEELFPQIRQDGAAIGRAQATRSGARR